MQVQINFGIQGGMEMRLDCIMHRSAFTDCYARNEEEIILNIRTGKDITAVNVIHEDPYIAGCSGRNPWEGKPVPMRMARELEYSFIWSVKLKPAFRREQYYFEIWEGTEKIYLLEDGFYSWERMHAPGRMRQYFKFPWLNEADVCRPPSWVEDTVWYQIMPDPFCRGNLPGITERLEYLKELGITGIYLTPVFDSDTSHKYNTFDYKRIDADFGDEEDMKNLIRRAHELGIRVMLDAVFNHCGVEFFAWKDVLTNGEGSKYYDWFFVNQPLAGTDYSNTRDGRYFSFAFEAYMPKLNTNNPMVMDYFLDICRYWVEEWGIDGIRFDVGNEISHAFIKRLRSKLKQMNPELFLLGEIWHDSVQWLSGDEYDSVMNYPFVESLNDFWVDNGSSGTDKMDSRGLMYRLNRCYSMYTEQDNRVLFNFLDTHDISRAYDRCGSLDILMQQLVVLMTMPGSPCLYYGTEVAMPNDPMRYNRNQMPWNEIDSGKYDRIINEVKALIALRKSYPHMKSTDIVWKHDLGADRLICYTKKAEGSRQLMEVYLNGQTPEKPQSGIAVNPAGEILYSRNYKDGCLGQDGILIRVKDA